MNGIHIYTPDDDNYDALEKIATNTGTAKSAATERYNDIAEAYNGAATESYISIPDRGLRLSNLEKVFFNRGLARDRDYKLSRPTVDINGEKLHRDDRPVLIRKLTDAVMRIV
jgi:hypothetical protein